MSRATTVATAAALLFFAPMPGATAAENDKPAAPLKLHMFSGSKEYKSQQSLTAFKTYIEKRYGVRCTLSLGTDGIREMPNLDALDAADVLVVFCRRVKIEGAQLEKIQKWCKAGKPVVGIRTASHAFQNWLAFDKEVLGGDYQGHGGSEPDIKVTLPAKARSHPILKGIKPWTRPGKLYKNPAIAKDVTLLLTATGRKDTQPVAWARTRKNGGRSFYTSMGVPTDFENETFLKLLVNAVFWTAKRPVPPARPVADKAAANQHTKE